MKLHDGRTKGTGIEIDLFPTARWSRLCVCVNRSVGINGNKPYMMIEGKANLDNERCMVLNDVIAYMTVCMQDKFFDDPLRPLPPKPFNWRL